MTRRRVLAAAAGLAIPLAGCGSSGESEAEAATDTTTETTTTTSDVAAIEAYLRGALTDAGLRDVSVNAYSEMVTLDYATDADTQPELAAEIGTVAGEYLNLIEYGYDPATLKASVYDAQTDREAGEYWIERVWADAVREGDITRDEFLRRIFGSIET